MAFLSESAVEQALLDQLHALGYGVESEEDIGPDGHRPERELAIRQIASRAVVSTEIVVILAAEAIATLSQIRDTLLPKLISGELRVPDAEVFLKKQGL